MKKVGIVGAGPSGLTTLKHLITSPEFLGNEPVEVRLFEADDHIGGTFYARMYEDGEVRVLLVDVLGSYPPRRLCEGASFSTAP